MFPCTKNPRAHGQARAHTHTQRHMHTTHIPKARGRINILSLHCRLLESYLQITVIILPVLVSRGWHEPSLIFTLGCRPCLSDRARCFKKSTRTQEMNKKKRQHTHNRRDGWHEQGGKECSKIAQASACGQIVRYHEHVNTCASGTDPNTTRHKGAAITENYEYKHERQNITELQNSLPDMQLMSHKEIQTD